MVDFVVALLEMPLNWRMPSLEPPTYPTDFPPEQPLQERVLAPLESVLEEDSASGVVSAGPGAQACWLEMVQLVSLVCGVDCLKSVIESVQAEKI